MNMQEYYGRVIKIVRNNTLVSSAQLTLGEVIDGIKKCGIKTEDGELKKIAFDFGTAIPTTIDSWRGSYDKLAIGYELSGCVDSGNSQNCTAKKILEELESGIGNTYTGWKGGEFTMDRYTPLWVSNVGEASNTGIIGVIDMGWWIMLVTAYCEF